MSRSLHRAAAVALLTALTVVISSTALSIELPGVTSVTLGWEAVPGDIDSYGVYVARNGEGRPSIPTRTVNENRVTVSGNPGDTLDVWVAAFDASGTRSPLSSVSDPLELVAVADQGITLPEEGEEGAPPGGASLYFESFEDSTNGADPDGWFDTGAGNSLVEDPSLFGVIALSDGAMAFGTESSGTNIHSHLRIDDSKSWSAYEFAGLMAIESTTAGIGVTLYSDYPNSDRYYRLRRYGRRSFDLAPHPDEGVTCIGTTDTGVTPQTGRWYRFRFQAFPDNEGTRVRAMIWEDGSAEPDSWQIDCVDGEASMTAGAPGVWSMGRGLKLWDELEVIALDSNGDASPDSDGTEPEPPAVEEPPPAPTEPPAPGGSALYAESFEGYGDGANPEGWFDTDKRNSLSEVPSLFTTFALSDGNIAFGTESSDTNIHSHLQIGDSAVWNSYEFAGMLSFNRSRASIGVTLYSDYPSSDRYYRLRSFKAGSFQLAPHPHGDVKCNGTTDSGVKPQAGRWYRFRFQAFAEDGGTRVRAMVWESGTGEPATWQIDCVDAEASMTAGAPGAWSMGRGLKLWDELEVKAIQP